MSSLKHVKESTTQFLSISLTASSLQHVELFRSSTTTAKQVETQPLKHGLSILFLRSNLLRRRERGKADTPREKNPKAFFAVNDTDHRDIQELRALTQIEEVPLALANPTTLVYSFKGEQRAKGVATSLSWLTGGWYSRLHCASRGNGGRHAWGLRYAFFFVLTRKKACRR